MADDVKVKFGGDFSEIDKDAQSASKRIGTALGAWVNDYVGEVKHKLKEAFSLANITEKFYEGVKEQFQKFEEIDNLARKLGVTRVELQQFGKLGEETGIDMETMGQAIAFANRQIGSMKDNEKVRKLMIDLGFSTKEVTSANIKSLDVLYKLADSYEKNKKQFGDVIANNMLAKDSSDLFGRSAYNLNGIIKEGNDVIKERINLMNTYSEAEIKSGARTSKQVKKGEEIIKEHTTGSVARFVGIHASKFEIFDKLDEIMKKEGVDYSGALNKAGSQIRIAEELAKAGKQMGYDPSDLADLISNRYSKPGRRLITGGDEKAFIGSLLNNLNEIQREADAQKKPTDLAIASPIGVLSASSLQQIGGGDVSSVLAGSKTDELVTYSRGIYENTAKMANEGTQPTAPASVAK